MIRRQHQALAQNYLSALNQQKQQGRTMAGLTTNNRARVLVAQIIESNRRIEFVKSIGRIKPVGPLTRDSSNPLFNPLKAAWHEFHINSDLDESLWLVLIATHFGKHKIDNWSLPAFVISGNGARWTYNKFVANPQAFQVWWQQQHSTGALSNFKFSNHRKYESLRPDAARATPSILESYVNLIGRNRSFKDVVLELPLATQSNPNDLFDELYHHMRHVLSFGRTAAFDFLTMAGNLGILPIEPGKPYLHGATGPLRGARLIFKGNQANSTSWRNLEPRIVQLGNALNISMQAMEDSLCNWQKSPDKFIKFRG